MYYDFCESLINIWGEDEVGNLILNECVFESGDLTNILDLREGFYIYNDILEQW